MDEFVSLVSNLGFPIAVTAYLLIRFEKKIDTLNENILNLNNNINKII
ncbi:MAG: YvrJ family protein [Sarcina sp.]